MESVLGIFLVESIKLISLLIPASILESSSFISYFLDIIIIHIQLVLVHPMKDLQFECSELYDMRRFEFISKTSISKSDSLKFPLILEEQLEIYSRCYH